MRASTTKDNHDERSVGDLVSLVRRSTLKSSLRQWKATYVQLTRVRSYFLLDVEIIALILVVGKGESSPFSLSRLSRELRGDLAEDRSERRTFP